MIQQRSPYRGYSLLLQRRITDFGTEKSFEKAAGQFKEHYGFAIPESAVRRITEGHGEAIHGYPELLQGEANSEAKAQLVGETDGTMVPIVNIDPSQDGDQRKTRTVCWKEVRLTLVYEPGTANPIYGATTGSPTQVGEELANCALHVGWDGQTKVHGVGDGASWIANQFEERFGAQGSYLIDLFHLGEYLAAASKSCSCDSDTWYQKMKAHTLTDRMDIVLNAMKPHIEPKEVDYPLVRERLKVPAAISLNRALKSREPGGKSKMSTKCSHCVSHAPMTTGKNIGIRSNLIARYPPP